MGSAVHVKNAEDKEGPEPSPSDKLGQAEAAAEHKQAKETVVVAEDVEWKKERQASKVRATSIADIYRKQSASTTDMDPTRYLFNDDDSAPYASTERMEKEFMDLQGEADYTRHALHYKDDVLDMSKIARRQTSAWRKKQSKRKKELEIMKSAKHHHHSIRDREFAKKR